MDRDGLGDFLRSRRERLRPEEVGLVAGARRRTPGLRRDEVALLAAMSTDYYERIEQGRGPQPSPSMLGAIARALRLTRDERDHVYLLAGHQPPPAHVALGYVDPGLMTILDALAPSVPAMVTDDLEGVLAQNALSVALLGPLCSSGGSSGGSSAGSSAGSSGGAAAGGTGQQGSSFLWHWFTDERYRRLYAENDRETLTRGYVADLRSAVARRGSDAESRALVEGLSAASEEFRRVWALQEVGPRRVTRKVLQHERVGRLDLECDVVVSPPSGQHLVLFRATPGTGTAERLAMLAVLGTEEFAGADQG